jgi:Flp pilus assembly protein TadD
VWDVATLSSVELKGHTGGVRAAAFSPDGKSIVTASFDNAARVWDLATRSSVELKGHTGGVRAAAFSPDGKSIITASFDNTARVWESVPYRERYPAIEPIRAAAAKMDPVVDARLKAGERPDALLVAFGADTTLTTEERMAARDRIQTAMDEEALAAKARVIEANELNSAAWKAVRFAPVTAEAAAKAVADARKAVELEPDEGSYLSTLGVALYRAGMFKEALDTLTRSDAINAKDPIGPLPSDRAFIAMTHWQLGQKDEARAALVVFRELAATDLWKADIETPDLLKEAQELIEPK